ncbi:hypothetical protein VPHD479_0150 [Vibrio phage D479]
MASTQHFIDVYTIEFIKADGEYVTDTVQGYSIQEARGKAEQKYPGVRFRAFYPSGTAQVDKHPHWVTKNRGKKRR